MTDEELLGRLRAAPVDVSVGALGVAASVVAARGDNRKERPPSSIAAEIKLLAAHFVDVIVEHPERSSG